VIGEAVSTENLREDTHHHMVRNRVAEQGCYGNIKILLNQFLGRSFPCSREISSQADKSLID
jgi:hypothetical protein